MSRRGPAAAYNVFRETCGLSLKAKRAIHATETAMTAFNLMVNEQMLGRIQVNKVCEGF